MYIVAWFSVDSSHLAIQDIFPEVSGFGVRPIHVGRQESNWMATFKLPPGLEPGWHDVRLRVKGSRLSPPVRIAVDLPLATNQIQITSVADGATWKQDEIDLTAGTTLALWLTGLPEGAHQRCIYARVDGRPAEVTYVEPPGPSPSRQVNVVMPKHGSEQASVEVSIGTAKADVRVRCIRDARG